MQADCPKCGADDSVEYVPTKREEVSPYCVCTECGAVFNVEADAERVRTTPSAKRDRAEAVSLSGPKYACELFAQWSTPSKPTSGSLWWSEPVSLAPDMPEGP